MPAAANTYFGLSRTLTVLLIAVWFGLLAGMLEGVIANSLRGVPGFAIRVSPEILWIAPAFNLIFFCLLGAGLVGLIYVTGKTPPLRWIAGLFTVFTVLCLLLLIGKLNQIAAFALSLGVGVQVARALNKRELRALTFFKKSGAALLVMAVLLGVTGASWDIGRERYILRNVAPPKSDTPNVLLITLDTLRSDHVSCYGYERNTTPNLCRLASQGVLFENSFANSSWTLPSHASMFTGRLPHEHKADWTKPLDNSNRTLAETLKAKGYFTGAFTANTSYVTPEWGLARGFSHFEAQGSSLIEDATNTVYGKKLALNILPRLGYFDIPGRKRASQVNAEFFHWLDRTNGKPFFAFLNFFDTHDPYLTDEPYRNHFSNQSTRGNLVNFQFQATTFRRKPVLTVDEVKSEVDGYDNCLAYLDAQIGELFAEMQRRGLEKNTLVIITSDHGESFGDHDLFGHGNSLYLETLKVPLILSWPEKLPNAKRVDNLVSLADIPATVMQLLGIQGENFPGRSLVDLWSSSERSKSPEAILSELSPGRFRDGPSNYPATRGGLKSLVTDQWHFIVSDSGALELYNWRSDPKETQNLVYASDRRDLVEQLKKQMQLLSSVGN